MPHRDTIIIIIKDGLCITQFLPKKEGISKLV
jgi:hypothetical protein